MHLPHTKALARAKRPGKIVKGPELSCGNAMRTGNFREGVAAADRVIHGVLFGSPVAPHGAALHGELVRDTGNPVQAPHDAFGTPVLRLGVHVAT